MSPLVWVYIARFPKIPQISGFKSEMILSPRGYLTISEDTFDCYNFSGVVTGINQIEAKNAGKHSTVHRTTPTTYNYSAQTCQ